MEWPCNSEADSWSISRQGSKVRLCLQCHTDQRSLPNTTLITSWKDVQAQKLFPVHTHLLICMDRRASPCLVEVKMLWGLVRAGLSAAAVVQLGSCFLWTCSLLCPSCHMCSRAFQTQIQINTTLDDMMLIEVFYSRQGDRDTEMLRCIQWGSPHLVVGVWNALGYPWYNIGLQTFYAWSSSSGNCPCLWQGICNYKISEITFNTTHPMKCVSMYNTDGRIRTTRLGVYMPPPENETLQKVLGETVMTKGVEKNV